MSNKINRFNYKDLRNASHMAMHDEFIAITANHPLEELALTPLLQRYVPAVETERKCFEVLQASVHLPELVELDRRRDVIYRGFRLVVEANTCHYVPEMQAVARRLEVIIKSYGNLNALPLDEETAKIDDLCSELRKTENNIDLSTLRLDEWLNGLTEANRVYREMVLLRVVELSGRNGSEMRKARLEVDKQFRSLLNYLDVMMDVNPSEVFSKFAAEVNTITRHYEHIVAQEQGVRDANKDKEDPMM